jgi:hypothetical protein
MFWPYINELMRFSSNILWILLVLIDICFSLHSKYFCVLIRYCMLVLKKMCPNHTNFLLKSHNFVWFQNKHTWTKKHTKILRVYISTVLPERTVDSQSFTYLIKNVVYFAFTVSNLHFLQNQLFDIMYKNIFRSHDAKIR